MRFYRIADIVLQITGTDEYVEERMARYEVAETTPDVVISVRHADVIERPEELKVIRRGKFRTHATSKGEYITFDELKDGSLTALIRMDGAITRAEVVARDIEPLGGASLQVRQFNMLAEVFRYVVLKRGGMIFHSSALSYKGEAILFSAPSGTGKSTHTKLWCQHVEGAEVFNDDSPAIMMENGVPVAYGTPWSGKSIVNLNVRLPIRAIVFLERGEINSIRRLTGKDAFLHVASQSFYVPFTGLLPALLDVQECIVNNVSTYKLACNISKEAVNTVYNQLYKG